MRCEARGEPESPQQQPRPKPRAVFCPSSSWSFKYDALFYIVIFAVFDTTAAASFPSCSQQFLETRQITLCCCTSKTMRGALSRCLSLHLQPFHAQVAAAAASLTRPGAALQQHQQAGGGLEQQPHIRDRTRDASCSPGCEQAGSTQHHHHQQQHQQLQQQHTHSRICWPLASLQQPHAVLRQQPHASSSSSGSLLQQQPLRCYASRVQVNPTMPPELASVITEHAAIKADRPPAPPLEPRPLTFESRRSGVIAIKAGMMQDWDEYGVRVPLTVLWIDECMVRPSKRHVGGCNHPRQFSRHAVPCYSQGSSGCQLPLVWWRASQAGSRRARAHTHAP